MATQHMDALIIQQETQGKETVEIFYKSLMRGDTETVADLLASDLEWWFHGPPRCEHMKRVLTGESVYSDFKVEPRSITAIDDKVIAEGWEGDQVYWVHVWSVKDGLITEFREYFNTWLTVKDLSSSSSSSSSNRSSRSSSNESVWHGSMCVVTEEMKHTRNTLWRSEPREHLTRSLPGLVLAI